MAQPSQPAVPSVEEREAFSVHVLRYLDGECSAEEIQRLKETLVENVSFRELFVQVCRMQGNLYEAYAPRRAEVRPKAKTATEAALTSDSPTERELPAGTEPRGAGAETIVRELPGEDTAFPEPKSPEQ
jgi:hypothetical protein